MIRLENMESLEPPGLHEQAQTELGELCELIRAEGLDAYVAELDETFHAHLEESAAQVAVDVLNVVLEHGVDIALGAVLEEVIRRWAKHRRFFRDRDGAQATAYIWGPDGEILKSVRLPRPDDSNM